jgi:hypothetical protein
VRTDVSHFASAVSLVLLVGPAVFDTALVVVSRVSTGRHIFMGGTDHTSHRLVLLGFRPIQVNWILGAFTACSCTLGVLVAEDLVNPWVAIPLAVVPASVAFVYLLRIGVYASDDGGGRNRLLKRPPRATSPELHHAGRACSSQAMPRPARKNLSGYSGLSAGNSLRRRRSRSMDETNNPDHARWAYFRVPPSSCSHHRRDHRPPDPRCPLRRTSARPSRTSSRTKTMPEVYKETTSPFRRTA